MCMPAAAGEGPEFDSACAQCYVAICGVPADTSPEFLSTAGMFPGVAVDVVVENLFVWVAVNVVVDIVDVWVAVVIVVEVASQSQRESSLMSVCTAAEEDATGCRSTEFLGTTGLAAGFFF